MHAEYLGVEQLKNIIEYKSNHKNEITTVKVNVKLFSQLYIAN